MLVFCFLLPILTIIVNFTLTQIGLSKMRSFAVDRFGARSDVVQENKETEKRHLKTSLIVAVTFIIVWTPYAIFSILQVLGHDVTKTKMKQRLFNSASLLAKCSAFLNPVIYAIRKQGFREAAVQVLSSIFRKNKSRRRSRTLYNATAEKARKEPLEEIPLKD